MKKRFEQEFPFHVKNGIHVLLSQTSLGELTFAVIQRHVQQIVTVSEAAIIQAMRHVWERMKILIEPSAAVPIGVLLEKKIDLTGKRIGVLLSGGNTDLDRLPWLA